MNRLWVLHFALITALIAIASAARAADVNEDSRKAIQAVDQQYIQAFNAKDAAAAVASFTDDAVYETDYGATLRGRAEIQDVLESEFAAAGNSTLKLNVYSIEFSPDKQKAVERGISIVTADEIEEPSSYQAIFEKQGDAWRVSKVIEQPEAPVTKHLKDLAWMIGKWNDESEDVSVLTKSEWALDRAFITRRFAVTTPGKRELKGIEYIGWDPERQQLFSRYFDSDGGSGMGRWRRDGKSWIEESSGTLPNGGTASATHIFTPVDSNHFTWRSIDRRVGDEKQDDIPEVTISRENERGSL